MTIISSDHIGVAKGIVIQEILPGAGFTASDFGIIKLGRLP